jgi:hypothetical protein
MLIGSYHTENKNLCSNQVCEPIEAQQKAQGEPFIRDRYP